MKMMFMYLDFVSISFVQHNGGELRRRRGRIEANSQSTANSKARTKYRGRRSVKAASDLFAAPIYANIEYLNGEDYPMMKKEYKDVVLQRRNGKDENERAKLGSCTLLLHIYAFEFRDAAPIFANIESNNSVDYSKMTKEYFVPIMLVIKAVDMETDLEVLQMIGRDPQYASLLFPSIERKKMSRFGKIVTRSSFVGAYGSTRKRSPQFRKSSIGLVDNQFLAVPVKSIVDKYPLFPVFPKMMFMYLDFVSISFAQHNGGELRRRRVELKPTANRLQIRRQGLNTEFGCCVGRCLDLESLERNLSFANWDVSRIEMIEKALHRLAFLCGEELHSPSSFQNMLNGLILSKHNMPQIAKSFDFGLVDNQFLAAPVKSIIDKYGAPTFANLDSHYFEDYPIMTKEYVFKFCNACFHFRRHDILKFSYLKLQKDVVLQSMKNAYYVKSNSCSLWKG
ncbi:hypothetical protein E3N88_05756 [Mikania micrantha]|uniref:Uncharacterized protein n=1 Tax=Mikania micrantha TaxID=192012 RepID=A0A5N6PP57_9ASTR|nr:hypothetical protein E3N88_05756 [Mikania micrantha]